ncbi:unnamed protein product [Absidia cylindrospora]
MTKDDPVEHGFQELTCDDTQPQQPFQVVLVDIEKAAKDRIIHCIETPLEGVFDFVALSYRWGELAESLIDTRLGYLASITSFDLSDFYQLCRLMREEPDLKSIQYVWVDAICVDQTNYERRKATIHQMSNIYDKATYILAVPNLHMQHLIRVLQARGEAIGKLWDYQEYIYYLLQGNIDKLTQLDHAFFDDIGMPKEDQMLRQLMIKYNHCFMDGNITSTMVPSDINAQMFVEQLYDISQATSTTHRLRTCVSAVTGKHPPQADRYAAFDGFFLRGGVGLESDWHARLAWPGLKVENSVPTVPWKTYILRRNNAIVQVMEFLNDLINDWSSRVWVISEYQIARKKNNLKYWFIGLFRLTGLPFFKFDFSDPSLPDNMNTRYIYRQFHQTLIKQLNAQTFFKKMLSSKASKNEDRFYAILPQTKYKNNVNQVGHWNINNMASVKLKLFEIMDTKDKLALLFLVGKNYDSESTAQILPTFATPKIDQYFGDLFHGGYPLNFDLLNNATITIMPRAAAAATAHQRYDYLQLTPLKGYSVASKPYRNEDLIRYEKLQKKVLSHHFQLHDIDFVQLTPYDKNALSHDEKYRCSTSEIYLVGSFLENIWILTFQNYFFDKSYSWDYYDNEDTRTVFNIY